VITTDLLKVIDKLYFHFELLLKSEKKNRNNVCIIYPFGAGMSYPSGAHEVFKGVRVYLDFCVVFCQSLFVFCSVSVGYSYECTSIFDLPFQITSMVSSIFFFM